MNCQIVHVIKQGGQQQNTANDNGKQGGKLSPYMSNNWVDIVHQQKRQVLNYQTTSGYYVITKTARKEKTIRGTGHTLNTVVKKINTFIKTLRSC
jgi:hypothetical protein